MSYRHDETGGKFATYEEILSGLERPMMRPPKRGTLRWLLLKVYDWIGSVLRQP